MSGNARKHLFVIVLLAITVVILAACGTPDPTTTVARTTVQHADGSTTVMTTTINTETSDIPAPAVPAATPAATVVAAATAAGPMRLLDMGECLDLGAGVPIVYKDYRYQDKTVVVGVHAGNGSGALCREVKYPGYWRVVWTFGSLDDAKAYQSDEITRVVAAGDANPQSPGTDVAVKVIATDEAGIETVVWTK